MKSVSAGKQRGKVMSYCGHCGKMVEEGSKFCNNCGAPVSVETNEGPQGQPTGNDFDRTRPLYNDGAPGYGQASGGYMPGGQGPNSYMAEGPQPPKKKKKTALVVTLVSLLVVAAAVAAILIIVVFNPEKKLKQYVEERDWTEADALYEKSFQGKSREDKADELFEEAVDLLEEEYEDGLMDASTARRHLKDIEDFWDDRSVEKLLEKIDRQEAEKEIVGTWRLTRIEAAGVTMDIDEFLVISGMEGTTNEMELKKNGTFSMEMVGERGSGTWERKGAGIVLTDEAGDSVEATYEGGELSMDLEGVVMIFVK